MRFASCYSGIGGSDAGLCGAGWELAWQAEADAFRRAVLARRFGRPVHERVETLPEAPEIVATDLLYAGLPDHRLDRWWPPLWRVAQRLVPRWLVCEFSPTVRVEPVLRELVAGGWAFRIVFARTALRLGAEGAWDVRNNALLLASSDAAAIDGLGLASMLVALTIEGEPSCVPAGTVERAEAERGLREGWTCACHADGGPGCACNRAARLSAVNDATPPYLTAWLAELVDGRWTDGRGTDRGAPTTSEAL